MKLRDDPGVVQTITLPVTPVGAPETKTPAAPASPTASAVPEPASSSPAVPQEGAPEAVPAASNEAASKQP